MSRWNHANGGVSIDKAGNLYGTTQYGGDLLNHGTLYKLTPSTNGWSETVLGTSSNAAGPVGAVTLDPLGNLYSTFSSGGENQNGGVFRLGRQNGTLAFFLFNGNDGGNPAAGVILDRKHDALFGTTSGKLSNIGTVFKITPPGKLTTLYTFCSQPNCSDGAGSVASLIEDEEGNLYGTTEFGGINNQGLVFEVMHAQQ